MMVQEEINQGWKLELLGNICKTTSGGTPSRSKKAFFQGDIPWVKSGELPDGHIQNVSEYITEEAIASSSAKLFPAGTLLIALYGATVGKLGVLTFEAASNQAVCAIFPEEGIKTKYLYWHLRYVRSDLIKQAIGGAQPNISQGILRSIPIQVAPPEKQKQIVEEIEKQFSRLDKAVANLKRVKANLKRYKASVLQAAVTGKLTEAWRKQNPDVEPASHLLERILIERRQKWEATELAKMTAKGKPPKNDKWKEKYKEPSAPDISNLPELPDSWVWATWEMILDHDDGAFKRGPFGSALKKSMFVESGYKVYEQYCPINDAPSFARYFVTEEKYTEMEGFAVKARDFLISCSGVTLGRITQIPDDYEAGIINQALLRVRIHKELMDDKYFLLLFRSPYFQKQIFANAQGAAIPNVKGVKELKAMPIPLQSAKEQQAIIQEIESRLSVTKEIEHTIDVNLKRAERLRQSILKQAFSGKLI